jgi:signal transduction histidine kinase
LERKIIISISIIFLLVNCVNKEKDSLKKEEKNNINELFNKGNNSKNTSKNRIVFLNEINEILDKSKNDSITRKYYSDLASSYFFLGLNEKYLSTCKKLGELSLKGKDTIQSINSIYGIGSYYKQKTKYDSAYYYYTKAEKLANKISDKNYLSFILTYKASLYTFQKNFTQAESTAIKALKIAKEKNNYILIYDCYITLGNALAGINNTQKALEYYKKAIVLSNKLSNHQYFKIYKAQPYNYIALIYQEENNFKEAIKYSNQGLSFDNFKQTDPSMYCYLINTIAYSKFKLGEKSVVNQFNETLKIGDSIQSIPIQITAKTYLGEFYLAQKDTLKAKTYLKDAQLLSHKNNIFEDELKILQLLALANPQNESFYSNRYIELNDSLQNIERATRDKYARIEFETDEISQQKNVVESENDKLTQRIWVISGFTFLILLVVVLWFLNKSQKNKTRELLFKQEQQKANEEIYQLMLNQQQKIEEGKQIEKRRISQELHDGVMGRLSSIRLNLFVLNKKTDQETINKCLEYIKDIQAIEKEIRTIAHDLNKNLFSDSSNFNSIVENLFTAIQNHTQINFILNTDERIDWETVNNNAKINSYRIIQEALQNIDKYAKAQTVTITMSKKDDAISIEIKDDGIGFNMKIAKDGIGLKNMQKRMEDIGGTFEIESYPKKGTKINLSIPI